MLKLERHAAWADRLIATVERHRAHKFEWGTYDCATLFADCVDAVAELDPLAAHRPWSGPETAARRLVASGHESVLGLVEVLFPEVAPSFAQRGDIGFARDTGALACPFIIVGAEAVSRNDRGFIVVPRDRLIRTFKVG